MKSIHFTKHLPWMLSWFTYPFWISWLVRLWCNFEWLSRCFEPLFAHSWWSLYDLICCLFVNLKKWCFFCIFCWCMSMARFWKRRIWFLFTTCPIIQNKKESFIFDFQCLRQYILFWKSFSSLFLPHVL